MKGRDPLGNESQDDDDEERETPEKNLMQIKKMQEVHDMNDPNQRLLFYLNLLRELKAVKKGNKLSMKNDPEKNLEKST